MITELCNVSHSSVKTCQTDPKGRDLKAQLKLLWGKQTQTERAMYLLCHMSSAHLSCLRLRKHCLTCNSGSRHRTTLTVQSWARALWVVSEPSWGVRIMLLWTTNIAYSSFWLRCDSRILLDISCYNMWISISPSKIHISQLILIIN